MATLEELSPSVWRQATNDHEQGGRMSIRKNGVNIEKPLKRISAQSKEVHVCKPEKSQARDLRLEMDSTRGRCRSTGLQCAAQA